jgi:hypothetical protein
LQELSDARWQEEYVKSRRRLGVSAESVWLVPKPSGGGVAVVYLGALDLERALRELATSEALFGSCYSGGMRMLFGLIWRGYHGDLTLPIYYVNGPPAMVTAMRETLGKAGVDDDNIRTDEFSGYSEAK